MTEAIPHAGHATDGDLLRLLDDELLDDERPLAAHVASCDECGARLARYRRRSGALHGLLQAAAPAPVDPARVRPPVDRLAGVAPVRRHTAPSPRSVVAARPAWWTRRAVRAAGIALVAAGVASASPVRAWLADALQAFHALLGEPTPPARAPVVPAPPVEPAPSIGARVRFAMQGDELLVHLATRQASGTLTVAASDTPDAEAVVTHGAQDEGLVILPGELRIENVRGSVASYHVALPRGVRRVRVRFADATGRGVVGTVARGAPFVLFLGSAAAP